jgi:hypothetical protein
MQAPITVVIFNRPEQTRRLYDRLLTAGPRDLFLISDGARAHVPEEKEKVDMCRSIFLKWPGRVHTNFSERNLGCKARISSGLTWVFENTERCIILEDDCLPHPEFFRFCDDLLDMYADVTEVMSICGTKFYPRRVGRATVFFSIYHNCWGWATWRRAWAAYTDKFGNIAWHEMVRALRRVLGSYRAALYWWYLLRLIRRGRMDSWAYCWMASCFLRSGLHIIPEENLVVNCGFGDIATHTRDVMSYVPREYGSDVTFPLSYPEAITSCREVDRWIEDTVYSKNIHTRMWWCVNQLRRRLRGRAS